MNTTTVKISARPVEEDLVTKLVKIGSYIQNFSSQIRDLKNKALEAGHPRNMPYVGMIDLANHQVSKLESIKDRLMATLTARADYPAARSEVDDILIDLFGRKI